MERELIKDFTLRVTQASKTELIVIMYDVILEDIKSAKKLYAMGNFDAYKKELKHACRFINELMSILDYTISLSHELLGLYSYVNRSLIKAYMGKTLEPLNTANTVISGLREAFAKISLEDNSGPIMGNVQQLYAGLTYGRGTLNESLLDPAGENRGYKV